MSQIETMTSVENPILTGPILPASLKLAIPVFIGHLLNYTYSVVDTLFISMLDKDSTSIISGIGLIFPVLLLIIALGTGIFAGTSSVLARMIGEKKPEAIGKIINTSILLAIGAALVFLLVYLVWKDDVLRLLAGDRLSQTAISNGRQYLNYLLPGMLLALIFFALAGMAQGAGLVQYFAQAMMLSTCCNIILDPICIFVLDLGVKGAAAASSISIGFSLIFLYARLRSKKAVLSIRLNPSLVDGKTMFEIVRIAVPQILTLAVVSIGMMVLNHMVGSVSETNMNAWVLVGRMDEILLIFGYAIGNATLTQVGQNFGNNDLQRVRSVYQTNIVFAILLGLGVAALYNLLASPLFSLFSTVAVVIDISLLQVRITSFSFVGILVLLVSSSMFQATGKAIPGLIINLLRIAVFILPMAYVVIYRLKSDIINLFIIIALANLLTLVISYGWSVLYLKKLAYRQLG